MARQPKRDGEEFAAVLALPVMGLGGLAFWWWQLGDEARIGWLAGIGRAAGYGPVPPDMAGQVEWLLTHRLNDFQGMFLLFVLVAVCGVIEGNARRQLVVLSGFGLRGLRTGRVLVLLWLGAVALSHALPVALPYGPVSVGLAALLGLAMYTLGRGRRRVQ